MSTTDTMKEYLAEHPRMIGVLFSLMLLLTQAGVVIGANNQTQVGP